MTSSSWAIGFVTLERPLAAQRFVRSARRIFPEVPIYVADQSRSPGPMAEFYEAEQVTVIRVPFDAGLSVSRNALVGAMDVDYFALCDDDFILGPATSFPSAIRILEQDEELGVVGGRLHDYDGVGERIRNWEMFFDHDERNRRFTATPVYNYPPVTRQVAGNTLYLCDAVMNFAVLRKAMFSTTIRWEESIKVNGEHEDFYLNLKRHSSWRVAYLPSMAALHWHVPQRGIYRKLRSRGDGRREFMRKWGLVSHLEIGTGGRPLDGTPVHDWFARDNAEAGGAAHADPQSAGAALAATAGISHSLLYGAVQREAACQVPAECLSILDWIGSDERFIRAMPAGQLLFRYQPAVDPEGDLLLWSRAMNPVDDAAGGQTAARVVLRWFSSNGDVLVWESEAHAIRCTEDRYWQPLAVQVPVWPAAAAWLRFEVVSACKQRTPLAAGFVFGNRQEPENPDAGESPGVLALCRTTVQAARVELAHQPLAELLASAPRVEIEVLRNYGQPWVTMDVSGFEFLGIVAGRVGEPSLLLSAGLRRARSGSVPLALPLTLVLDPEMVLFAVETGPAGARLSILVPRLIDVMPAGGSGVFAGRVPGHFRQQ